MAGKIKIYVGIGKGTRKVFRAFKTPTKELYGDRYNAVIGPFKTLRGARYMANFGHNNPHLQTVRDAEELAKMDAERQSLDKSIKKILKKKR